MMVFQGSELGCEVCEKTFPRKEMIFSVQNSIAVCENCLRNWRLNGGRCVICFEPVDRNQVWGFFRQKKAFGHFKCGGLEINLSTSIGTSEIREKASTWALFEDEHVEGIPLKYCEFRVTDDPTKPKDSGNYEVGNQIICEAGGNYSLGILGKDTEKIVRICQSCDIPVSLSKGTSPCLHLIPFRVFNGNEVQSYYTCQWFFSFDPKGAHNRRESQCGGTCLFWFLRVKNKPRLFDPKCEKFLKMFLKAEHRKGFFPPEKDHK